MKTKTFDYEKYTFYLMIFSLVGSGYIGIVEKNFLIFLLTGLSGMWYLLYLILLNELKKYHKREETQ